MNEIVDYLLNHAVAMGWVGLMAGYIIGAVLALVLAKQEWNAEENAGWFRARVEGLDGLHVGHVKLNGAGSVRWVYLWNGQEDPDESLYFNSVSDELVPLVPEYFETEAAAIAAAEERGFDVRKPALKVSTPLGEEQLAGLREALKATLWYKKAVA